MGLVLRLALLAVMAWMVLRFLRNLGINVSVTRQNDTPPGAAGNEAMRRCAYCNVHVPEGESTRSRGHFFCCEAHRDAFQDGKRG